MGNSRWADSCNGDPDAPLESCPKADPLAFGPVKGDMAEEEVFGSTIGDKPDKFRLREPSARDGGPMMAVNGGCGSSVVVFWYEYSTHF